MKVFGTCDLLSAFLDAQQKKSLDAATSGLKMYGNKRAAMLHAMGEYMAKPDFADMLSEAKSYDDVRLQVLYGKSKTVEARTMFSMWKEYDALKSLADFKVEVAEKVAVETSVNAAEEKVWPTVLKIVGVMTASQTLVKPLAPGGPTRAEMCVLCIGKLESKNLTLPPSLDKLLKSEALTT